MLGVFQCGEVRESRRRDMVDDMLWRRLRDSAFPLEKDANIRLGGSGYCPEGCSAVSAGLLS